MICAIKVILIAETLLLISFLENKKIKSYLHYKMITSQNVSSEDNNNFI